MKNVKQNISTLSPDPDSTLHRTETTSSTGQSVLKNKGIFLDTQTISYIGQSVSKHI